MTLVKHLSRSSAESVEQIDNLLFENDVLVTQTQPALAGGAKVALSKMN